MRIKAASPPTWPPKPKQPLSLREEFQHGLAGAAGKALATAAIPLAAYGIYKATRPSREKKFKAMMAHVESTQGKLDKTEHAAAKKYFEQIHRHAPDITSDPIASWNTVQHFLKHPGSYTATTVTELRKSRPQLPFLK